MANSPKLINNSSKFIAEFEKQWDKSISDVGKLWTEIATKLITKVGAIDTGAMRQSVSFVVDGTTLYVGYDIKGVKGKFAYPVYVELGTDKMPARPTLRPSVLDYRADYEQIFKDNLGG